MGTPIKGNRFVALSAAAAFGIGSVIVTAPSAMAATAAPAQAGGPQALASPAAEAFGQSNEIAAIGYGKDGQLVAQVVKDSDLDADSDELSSVAEFAKATTDQDLEIQEVSGTYETASTESPDPTDSPDGEPADTDLVGGAGYLTLDEGGSPAGLCSFGFPATGPDGEEAIISAGHCAEEGTQTAVERPSTSNAGTGDIHGEPQPEFLHEGQGLGEITYSEFGPDVWEGDEDPGNYTPANAQDFSVITVDEGSDYVGKGEVTDWTTAESDVLSESTVDVNGVVDVTEDHIDETAVRSGRTSGEQDGPVGGDIGGVGGVVDGYAPIGDPETGEAYMVYGFAIETLGIPGDSGGSVMIGDQAAGIVSGSNYQGEGTGDFVWAAELHQGLENEGLSGYEIKTADSDDPTDEPTETDDPTDEPTETDDPTDEPTETDDPTDEPTETEEPAELAVDPTEIAAGDFVADDEEHAEAEDRGVTYTVTDVEPGSEVTFDTYTDVDTSNAAAGSEEAPEDDGNGDDPAQSVTVEADENGVASSRIWGLTSAEPEAYIGDYDVVATTTEDTLEGSFEVVAGDDDGNGGEDDEGNGDDDDDLPRTGSTAGPLAAGAAGLVALGGALVYITRRRHAMTSAE